MVLRITALLITTVFIPTGGNNVAKTLPESPVWVDGIFQLEMTTPVLGGDNGPDNWQAQQLASRTSYLKQYVDSYQAGESPLRSLDYAQQLINEGRIPEGAKFSVRSSDPLIWSIEGQNVSGTAVLLPKDLPSGAYVKTVSDRIQEVDSGNEPTFSSIDFAGFPHIAYIDGVFATPEFDVFTVPYPGQYSVDKNFFAVAAGAGSSSSSQPDWLQETIDSLEQLAEQSRWMLASVGNTVVSLVANYIHFIYYGQSLQNGTEAYPRLSRTQFIDSLMFGDSVMPKSPTAPEFVPRNGAELKPLIATCCDAQGNSLTDEQVAAAAPGTIIYGESPAEGFTNSLRRKYLDYFGKASDSERVFVASAAGVGGRTVAQLSKNANPNLYQRFVDAMQGVKAIADAEGKSYQVGAVVYIQGENDYPNTSKAAFKAATIQLLSDMQTDRIAYLPDNRKFPILTVQTGASYTRDDKDMSVGMAQLEIDDELDFVFMVGPYYPYTNKPSGHLDANGTRNLGEKITEVGFRVSVLKQSWKCVKLIKAVRRGKDVLLAKHVPVPPLQFKAPRVGYVEQSYADKGYSALDRVGGIDMPIAIVSVEIKRTSVIHLELEREPIGELIIRYADKTNHDGNGMVCDSSQGLSLTEYTYLADSGMYPEANIPELVNKPYGLENWSTAYQTTPEVI